MTTATTIVELRSTLLQVPWRGKPPAAGILSAPFRDIYVLEIETQGGLLGMSYLMPLRGGAECSNTYPAFWTAKTTEPVPSATTEAA